VAGLKVKKWRKFWKAKPTAAQMDQLGEFDDPRGFSLNIDLTKSQSEKISRESGLSCSTVTVHSLETIRGTVLSREPNIGFRSDADTIEVIHSTIYDFDISVFDKFGVSTNNYAQQFGFHASCVVRANVLRTERIAEINRCVLSCEDWIMGLSPRDFQYLNDTTPSERAGFAVDYSRFLKLEQLRLAQAALPERELDNVREAIKQGRCPPEFASVPTVAEENSPSSGGL